MKSKKILLYIRMLGIVFLILLFYSSFTVSAAEPYVVVIDPGHGGENLGTNYLPTPEKYYNMIVANHMKTRLEEYENIVVYMTHTEDVDMTLEERAKFADSVDADFLFSLHFNQSIEHKIYGAEVWIPTEGALYGRSYGMAYEFLDEFEQMGLFNRGIKTRLGKKGDDYYGIIRHCASFGIPALIVEHCHVDHPYDVPYLMSEASLQEFGYHNADAVARYFALSTKDGSINNSEYAPLEMPAVSGRVSQDFTKPVLAVAELVTYDRLRGNAVFHLTAMEKESYIQHYAYSLDNGLSWSMYYPWTQGVNSMTIQVNVRYSKTNRVLFKVLNQYDNDRIAEPVYLHP